MYDFKGQTAIITGGVRGIGKSIVEGFLGAGARVIIASNEVATEQFKQDTSEFADKIDIQICDVSKYEEVEKFFEYVDKKYEGFEILVNNAGIRLVLHHHQGNSDSRDRLTTLRQRQAWLR